MTMIIIIIKIPITTINDDNDQLVSGWWLGEAWAACKGGAVVESGLTTTWWWWRWWRWRWCWGIWPGHIPTLPRHGGNCMGNQGGNDDDDDTCGPWEGGELDEQVEGIVRSSAIFPPRFIVTWSSSWSSIKKRMQNADHVDGYYYDDGYGRIWKPGIHCWRATVVLAAAYTPENNGLNTPGNLYLLSFHFNWLNFGNNLNQFLLLSQLLTSSTSVWIPVQISLNNTQYQIKSQY